MIQNIQMILNFNKIKFNFFRNIVYTAFPNVFIILVARACIGSPANQASHNGVHSVKFAWGCVRAMAPNPTTQNTHSSVIICMCGSIWYFPSWRLEELAFGFAFLLPLSAC